MSDGNFANKSEAASQQLRIITQPYTFMPQECLEDANEQMR